jgi:TonB family protein
MSGWPTILPNYPFMTIPWRLEVDLFAMKALYLLLLFALLPIYAPSQTQPSQQFDQVTSREFLKQLLQDGVYNFVSSTTAESLITHRAEPVTPHGDMMARVSGTVIIAFEITKDGKVRHAMVVSGPRMLQGPVLAAFRQWTFKPYTPHGEPTTVACSIPITFSNF